MSNAARGFKIAENTYGCVLTIKLFTYRAPAVCQIIHYEIGVWENPELAGEPKVIIGNDKPRGTAIEDASAFINRKDFNVADYEQLAFQHFTQGLPSSIEPPKVPGISLPITIKGYCPKGPYVLYYRGDYLCSEITYQRKSTTGTFELIDNQLHYTVTFKTCSSNISEVYIAPDRTQCTATSFFGIQGEAEKRLGDYIDSELNPK